MIIDLNEKITIPQAAKILGLTRQRVWQMVGENKIKLWNRFGRDVFLDKAEIIKLRDARLEGARDPE